jgi:UDP-2,3-diacylglucosamine hydrolase
MTESATVLFVSDLHLDSARPAITELFLTFLRGEARSAAALYILGDLFEAWIGDDDPDPHHARVMDAMRELADSGVPGFFMHGNRDFLVGPAFAERTGFSLLDDPALIELDGEPTLLMHGDTLCTDDHEYQAFRQQVRNPDWQAAFLAQPVEKRRAFAAEARRQSREAQTGKADAIMDVNAQAVAQAFRDHNVRRLIHGHTHRPAVHAVNVDGLDAQRIVLGDWYEQGSVLRCRGGECRLEVLENA